MTAMWFGLAAIALVGAIVLLYFDRVQRQRTGHARQVWAKAQGYTYVSVEPALPSTWRRGALAKLGYLSAVDVVSGIRKGEKFVLFDLEDAATLVAVRRQIGSDIDVDMRLKTASPPKDADLELLGAIGDRVVFATNPEIARHAVDQRMVAFIETLSDTVQMLWSEGNWTLGMLNVGTAAKDWESAIDAVLRLSGLLHVLPPVSDPRGANKSEQDPDRPHPRTRDRAESARSEPVRGASRVLPPGADDDDRDFGYDDRDDESRYDEDYEPDERETAGEQSRRPSLAVVPDARARTREDRWSDDDEAEDDWRPESRRGDADDWADEPPASRPDEQDRPGGPFHPGFRPYQGPVPQ
ncbi:hypothetical protein [Nocardia bhagyanarayanae]|uniref:Uncharacterized protein n=1 Tax=Nocardia bhagyanarayanae TaxID=1215925 RepID=A0A543F813_9NOCA|nr:hypothetical protein [Nocardia bhagyanarayanae]TQM29951.1 hypothetical protein FB390_1565 [Nocardia bhagyanarayanae]